MRRFAWSVVFVGGSVIASAQLAHAGFATSAFEYVQGNVRFEGASYSNKDAAVGQPNRISGLSIGFPGPVTPFAPAWEESEAVAVGRGGTITLDIGSPVTVTGTAQIGIFTVVGFADPTFTGNVANPAATFAGAEYGADRTAIVEVASSLDNFVSLGRIIFTNPTQGYANQTTPYDFPDEPRIPSDFDKPFLGDLDSFSGLNASQISTLLDGSAGGTWLSVPESLGLTEIRYIRISDPKWRRISDGELFDELTSQLITPEYIKPADLLIDGVNVIPEPAGGLLAMIGLGALAIRRRRNV